MKALAIRTKMAGNVGHAYELMIPVVEAPQHAQDYATHRTIYSAPDAPPGVDGREFITLAQATVTPEHVAREKGWDKLAAWNEHERKAGAIAAAALREVFPEFALDRLPILWIEVHPHDLPSAKVWTEVQS